MDPILETLRRLSRRLRLYDGWNLAQRTLWIAALVALLIQGLGRLLPIEGLGWWTAAPFILWLLGVIGYSAFRPQTTMHVARRVDIELGLFERLSTNLAMRAMPQAFAPTLVEAQSTDAIRVARAIDPSRAYSLTLKRRHLGSAALLSLAVLLISLAPNPMQSVLAERRAVENTAQHQAERIEQLRQAIAEAEGLSEQDREELLRQLADLAAKLRANPGDLEQALADIARLEEALRARQDPNSAAQAANLEALAEQLQALTGQPPDQNQDAAQAISEALSKLAEEMDSMEAGERQQLAETLAQMAAQAAQAGNQQLAQALAELAQAVQTGDQTAAQQSAEQAAQAAQQAQQQANAQQALQQAMAQLQNSRQQLSQASAQARAQAGQSSQQAGQSGQQSGQSGQTAGQSGQQPGQSGQSSGQSAGQSPSQSPGSSGQSSGSQPGGPGGGTTSSSLPPTTGQGAPNLLPTGSKPAGEEQDLSSQVYVPRTEGTSNGEELFIPGQDTGQGESTSTPGQSSQPGTFNPSLLPYSSVFYQYMLAANQAMQQGYIPLSLLTYIRLYFSQLEAQQ